MGKSKFLVLLIAIFLVVTLSVKAEFTLDEQRRIENNVSQTDLIFVDLLKQVIDHRLFLLGGSKRSPYFEAEFSRSFVDLRDEADRRYLTLFFNPKMTDAKSILFEETRAVLNEYKNLTDLAHPLEISDIYAYIYETQESPLFGLCLSLVKEVEGLPSIRDLLAYRSIVENTGSEITKTGQRLWTLAKEDFEISEYGFPDDPDAPIGFTPARERRNLGSLELTYGSFVMAIKNNPDSQYVPHAHYRMGDILLEQADILLFDHQNLQLAEEKLNAALKHYRSSSLLLHPDHPRAEYTWFWLAQTDYDHAHPASAKESFEKVIQTFPNNSGVIQLNDNAIFAASICESDLAEPLKSRQLLSKLLVEGSRFYIKVAQARLAQIGLPTTLFSVETDLAILTKSDEEILSFLNELFENYGEQFGITLSESATIENRLADRVFVFDPETEQNYVIDKTIERADQYNPDNPESIANVKKLFEDAKQFLPEGIEIQSVPISEILIYDPASKITLVLKINLPTEDDEPAILDVFVPTHLAIKDLETSQYNREYEKLKFDPARNILSAFVVMAEIQNAIGNYETAIDEYKEAIAYYHRLQNDLGSDLDDYFSYDQVVRDNWYYKSLLGLSDSYFQIGQLDLCIGTLDQLINSADQNDRFVKDSILRKAYLLLGDSHYLRSKDETNAISQNDRIKDHERAIYAYELIAKEYPPLSVNRNNRLANTYAALDMADSAIAIITKQLATLSTAEIDEKIKLTEMDLNYRMLGAIHFSAGDYEKAIASYNQIQGETAREDISAVVAQIESLQKKEALLGNGLPR